MSEAENEANLLAIIKPIICNLLEGNEIGQAEANTLNDVLKRSSVCRQYYRDIVSIDSMLRLKFSIVPDEFAALSPSEIHHERQSEKISLGLPSTRNLIYLLAATAAIVLMTFGFLALRRINDLGKQSAGLLQFDTDSQHYLLPIPVARIEQVDKVTWSDYSSPVGTFLSNGLLSLDRGRLRLSMGRGAELTLTAPFEVQLFDNNSIELRKGTMIADLPPYSRGFSVLTRNGTLSDLGTIYTAHVDDTDVSVGVMQGTVELQPDRPSVAPLRLNDNQAAIVGDSKIQTKEFQQVVKWNLSPLPLFVSGEPTRVLHWSFDQESYDNAGHTTWHETIADDYDFSLIQFDDGKSEPTGLSIPGKFESALEIVPLSSTNSGKSKLRAKIPAFDSKQPFTLSFWLKLPENDTNDISTIAASRKFDDQEQLVAEQWLIGVHGTGDKLSGMPGAVHTRCPAGSIEWMTNLRDNQWHHIAMVYTALQSDEVATNIQIYIDGIPDQVSSFNNQRVVQPSENEESSLDAPELAVLELGASPQSEFTLPLSGAIDELYLIYGAASMRQIQHMKVENKAPATDSILPSRFPPQSTPSTK